MGVVGARTLTEVPYATARIRTVEAKEISVVESNRSGGKPPLAAVVTLEAMLIDVVDALGVVCWSHDLLSLDRKLQLGKKVKSSCEAADVDRPPISGVLCYERTLSPKRVVRARWGVELCQQNTGCQTSCDSLSKRYLTAMETFQFKASLKRCNLR